VFVEGQEVELIWKYRPKYMVKHLLKKDVNYAICSAGRSDYTVEVWKFDEAGLVTRRACINCIRTRDHIPVMERDISGRPHWDRRD
jgi:nuclear transport factor 2 (NTF2) superfamily protein